MQGEYIVHRLLPVVVRGICREHGIDYIAFSHDWVLRLEKDDTKKWIVGYTFDINSAGSTQISSDKVACYTVMAHAGIPAIEHYLVRSRALSYFLDPPETLERVVVKPLSSSSGLGVLPFDTVRDAKKYIMDQPTGDWALCPRYEITSEHRYFMLDGQLLLTYKKTHPGDNQGLPMYNLGQGARATIVEPESIMSDLALKAQRATGLRLCAVDIVQLDNGESVVMEINSGFMMEHFARQSDEYYQKTHELYETIILAMMAE